jgi:hypothetical protein
MPSFIWTRSLEDAFDEPYEYSAQEQFFRESATLLKKFKDCLSSYDMQFTTFERSKEKAIWILVNDAVSSLNDCLFSLKDKNHRIAGRMYRDVIETLDLAAYFNTDNNESRKYLIEWYNDEVVPNRVYRDYVKRTNGETKSKEKSKYYSDLSKFTHRTYRTLLFGYGQGVGNKIYYDGYNNNDFSVMPQTISIYYIYLRDLIQFFSLELSKLQIIDSSRIDQIWLDSLESDSVPRRFLSPKEVFDKFKKGEEPQGMIRITKEQK